VFAPELESAAGNGIAVFVIRLAFIQPIDGKRIFENITRNLECNAMTGDILGSLDVILLKFSIIYKILLSSSFVKDKHS
jgi:hypothetical protein